MAGVHRISNVAVFGGISHIPHRTICNYFNITVFFPRTGKRNCKQVLLAINNWRNRRRRIRDWSDKPVLKSNCPLSSRRTPRNPGIVSSVIPRLDHGTQVILLLLSRAGGNREFYSNTLLSFLRRQEQGLFSFFIFPIFYISF